MEKAAATLCKALLETLPDSEQRIFCLTEKERAKLEQAPTVANLPSRFAKLDLTKVDPMRIQKVLSRYSKHEVELLLSALPKKIATTHFTKTPLKESAQDFFAKQFYKELLEGKELLPRELLPDSSCNELLTLYPDQIKSLLDLLGLHDLASSIRKELAADKLRALISNLNQIQRSYLNQIRSEVEPLSFPPFDGKEPLEHWIRRRSINRIAKALYFEGRDLKNLLLLALPQELEEDFEALSCEIEHKEYLKKQLLSLIKKLKQHKATKEDLR